MKTIAISILGLVTLSLTSTCWATPVYTGNTVADFVTNPGPASDNASGYYLWSDADHDDWSIRWTGNDYGTTTWHQWFGTIELTNLITGTVKTVAFESSTDQLINAIDFFGADQDFISFNAYTGPGWDGFDFEIDTSAYAVVDWELGSTMFDNMTPNAQAQGSMGIYIGQAFNAPLVQVQQRSNGRKVQRFETVPEPMALLLMASGLIGLGSARIRHRN